ncbi:hypothetical protein D3C74_443680 [compost metagenome]
MIVHHIHDTFHSVVMDRADQTCEILQRSKLRVNLPVVLIGIRTAESAFAGHAADRMNRQQPDDIHTQPADPPEIPLHSLEGSFFTVIADINRIDNTAAQRFRR